MKHIALISFIALTLGGCTANQKAVYRAHDFGKGAILDAKTRAVISKKDRWTEGQIVCAEPSPDALSAFAAEAAGSASVEEKINLSGAISSQESAAYIGLRTQSIQLLRDALFRLCEGYANGAINGKQFELMARRYQRNMVVLLAVEQLTGTVRVPPITLSTTGSASAAQPIDLIIKAQGDAMQEKTEVSGKVKKLSTEKEEKEKELTKLEDKSTAEAKALAKRLQEINDELPGLSSREATLAQAITQYGEAIKNPGGHAASGSATAQIMTLQDRQIDTEALKLVAATVKDMVRDITDTKIEIIESCLAAAVPDRQTLTAIQFLSAKEKKTPAEQSDLSQYERSEEIRREFLKFCKDAKLIGT